MLTKINHVGVAVKSLEEAIPFYRDMLKMQFHGTEEVAEQKVRVAMFQVGESKIELLEPTSEDSPIAKALEKMGGATHVHHLAYEVEDCAAAIATLKAAGARMVDESPRNGAHGTKIAFVHPKSSGGILTELCQCGSCHN